MKHALSRALLVAVLFLVPAAVLLESDPLMRWWIGLLVLVLAGGVYVSLLRRLNTELEARIADRTAALQAALGESRRLAAIIEATSDYVGIADTEGRSVYINRAGCELVGLSNNADKRGHSVIDCYPPREMPKVQEMVSTAMGGGVWSGETLLRHANGSEIPVSEVTFALRDESGRIEYLATIIRDNTAREAQQAQLLAAKEAAEAANRAKSAFLASMSHEIRTPMNAVIGMTSLLRETPLSPRQRDFVETIRTSGDALLTVINDILDFSKIEAEKLELSPKPFVLRDTVEEVLDLLAPRAAEKGLELACFFEPGVPIGVEADFTRLRQILVNLVGNALKFTEVGEVVVSVSSRAIGPLQELHFCVRDTGCGIPADKTARLFQPFSQVDASPTRAHGGTGLGLAISRRLTELLGGRMWVESNGVAGEGSKFHFTITAPEADVSSDIRRRSAQLPELRGKRVLVVDDNSTNRRILTLQVQNWGLEPIEAATAEEALECVRRSGPFDLALLDMRLPCEPGGELRDGVDLARRMCELVAPRRMPMVMLASVGMDSRRDVEAVGCFESWLTKPVKSSQLYDAIVGALAPRTAPVAQPMRAAARNGPLLGERIPLRILVAEDVTVNQKFIRLALEQMGYRADVVADGAEAIEAVRRQPYDVIFMDVQMPELDGLEATRRIRTQLPRERQPYIAAMTANAMQGDKEMCLDAGMDDYVSKPVYLAELRSALERAAGRQAKGPA